MKINYFLVIATTLFLLLITIDSLQAQLHINEFMASNDISHPDPQGDYSDWIELYNSSGEDIVLGGYFLSDKLNDPEAMFQIPDTFPDSVTIPAGGFIVFYANKGEASSVLNLNFKLGAGGEAIGLWSPQSVVIDTLTYTAQTTNVSFGRIIDGNAEWSFFVEHDEIGFTCSPNRSNVTLKFNELVAKNDNGIVDEFGNFGDWIELYNYGLADLQLEGLHMSDVLETPGMYTFNPALISAGEFLLIWCDGTDEDPITPEDTLHANFKLDAGGETIALFLNDFAVIDMLSFDAQTADISFGCYPDGTVDLVFFTEPTPRTSNLLTVGLEISEVIREPMFPEYTDEVKITAGITSAYPGLTAMIRYNSGMGYLETPMYDDGLHNDGEAEDGLFGGAIPPLEKGSSVFWYIEANDDQPFTLLYPEGGQNAPLLYRVTDWTPEFIYEMPFSEPSGLAYNELTGTLFTNNDGASSNVFEITTEAQLIDVLPMTGSDFEGLAFSWNFDTIFVVEETNWKIIMFNMSGEAIGEIEVEHNSTNTSGLEGIAIDPISGNIIVLAEKFPSQLIELSVNGDEISRFELDYMTDVSGLAIHPSWNTLMILSDQGYSLNEITRQGELLRSWYIPLDQAEGITFGEDEHTLYMVADRGGKLYKFNFDFAPFVTPTELYINEFMATNNYAFPGPQDDYPDWIEIYNGSNEDVNMGGYFLSDELTDPSALYQIPETYPDSVTVPAEGFIVFYANKGQESSVLNLDFKLIGTGESIGLWTPDQIFVDSLSYTAQNIDISYGRSPDGSEEWELMPNYTPGAPNHMVSIMEVRSHISELQNFPNPFKTQTTIRFVLDKPDQVLIRLFDITGCLVSEITNGKYLRGTHNVELKADNLPAGQYFYNVQSSGSILSRKVMILQ